MGKFIAAMDHSGGSTGGVLERYGQAYTEADKMDKVHDMRMRMVGAPMFNKEYIWAAILYKDTVDRGMVPVLQSKDIQAILKIDSGCEDNGKLKDFDVDAMIAYAQIHKCYGTKMRSIIKTPNMLESIVQQQFEIARDIASAGLVPIIEPEIPINHPDKADIEEDLAELLHEQLTKFTKHVIFKLTLPEANNQYAKITSMPKTRNCRVVGLSGGYNTEEACRRLKHNDNMSASFSRALSEGLRWDQTTGEFLSQINMNIANIAEASSDI